ncbi:unnamed protein product [Adineta ricciae]|uniref:Uncharacterized protein n=1 Tax=Adineta ricciae TaxID=249248 RepID=A0A815V328_ADIRI|nr:unnamed protein product [Adineta ricciae]
MIEIKMLLTGEQKPKLDYNGYLYTVGRRNKERISFRCKKTVNAKTVVKPIQSFERIIEEDDFNRVSILTDFKSGTIESIHSIFPSVVHKGTGRTKPQFSIELWNVYDRLISNLPHSNNSIEDWHNAFVHQVSIGHSTSLKLTEKIPVKQSKFEIDIARIRQDHESKPKKTIYRKLDSRITRLITDYGNVNLSEYFKNIAVNVSI